MLSPIFIHFCSGDTEISQFNKNKHYLTWNMKGANVETCLCTHNVDSCTFNLEVEFWKRMQVTDVLWAVVILIGALRFLKSYR